MFSFSVVDTSGMDTLSEKIKNQKEYLKELTEELEGFVDKLEAKSTDGFTVIEVPLKQLTAFEKAILKTKESFLPLEEKLKILKRLYDENKISLEQYNQELKKVSKVFSEFVINSDPLEEYKKTIEELDLLLKEGIISIEQYANASADAMIKMTKATEKINV